MTEEIQQLEKEIGVQTDRLFELRKQVAPKSVADFNLVDSSGDITLKSLFEGETTLFLIHNMGIECSYCTLWADGLTSTYPFLKEHGAVALVSPNTPEVQAQTKAKRGWPYKMASDKTGEMTRALGFLTEQGWGPGVSVLQISDSGEMTITGQSEFGPGDPCCPIWHFLSLKAGGAGDWEPGTKD